MAKKKGKGRGWHGDSAGHAAAARKGSKGRGPKSAPRRGGSKKTKAPKKKFKVAKPFDPSKYISTSRKKKFPFSSQFI